MLPLKRTMARDRRRAAIHEAGHVTMARHLGARVAFARLEKTFAGTPEHNLPEHNLWIGHTRFYFDKILSGRKKAMIAVAGTVSEHCWERCSFEYVFDIWDDPDVMSPSDWAGTGCTPGELPPRLLGIIEHTFSLFNPETGILWPELIKEARRLIIKDRFAVWQPSFKAARI